MGEWRSIVFLGLGVVVGWSAARYQGGLPRLSITASTASAASQAQPTAFVEEGGGLCTGPIAPKAEKVVAPSDPAPLSLRDQLSTLRISEIEQVCSDAETDYLNAKMSQNGKAIYEYPAPERDALIAEWSRRYAELQRNGGFWQAQFSQEFGADAVSVDVLLDFYQSPGEENSQCSTWQIYYEVNGRPTEESLYSMGVCAGSGYRKKGEHFYFDMSTYHLPGIGKHISVLLLPLPGAGGAEYLGGEVEKWTPISQLNWRRSSIIEHSQLRQRFQAKIDQLGAK